MTKTPKTTLLQALCRPSSYRAWLDSRAHTEDLGYPGWGAGNPLERYLSEATGLHASVTDDVLRLSDARGDTLERYPTPAWMLHYLDVLEHPGPSYPNWLTPGWRSYLRHRTLAEMRRRPLAVVPTLPRESWHVDMAIQAGHNGVLTYEQLRQLNHIEEERTRARYLWVTLPSYATDPGMQLLWGHRAEQNSNGIWGAWLPRTLHRYEATKALKDYDVARMAKAHELVFEAQAEGLSLYTLREVTERKVA